jgi:hypothetical protein
MMILKQILSKQGDWIYPTQVKDQWPFPCEDVNDISGSIKTGEFL